LVDYFKYLNNRVIDEIVICDETGDDYRKILADYPQIAENPQIKLVKNDAVLGVFRNKLKVASLATHEYVALIDSDNFCNAEYFIRVKEYINKNKSCLTINCLFSPVFSKPHFNYSQFEGRIITKKNIKSFINVGNFLILLNTGNCVLSRNLCRISYHENLMEFISACDVLYFNLLFFQQYDNMQFHTVKNLTYIHEIHQDSEYIKTIKNCEHFRDTALIPAFSSL
jgi:hypothetical protein